MSKKRLDAIYKELKSMKKKNLMPNIVKLLLSFLAFMCGMAYYRIFFTIHNDYVSEDVLWNRVQNWRVQTGLPKYIINYDLCIIADMRVEEIKKEFNHDGFFDHSPEYLYYSNMSELAENLVKNYPDEDTMLSKWLDSEGHRRNLQDGYTYSCIRCSENHCVQIFGE